MDAGRFFDFARARHRIYLARQAGVPRHEWTDDPILRTYKFTNVYRELDRTTIALRKMTQALDLHPSPLLLMFVVAMRWFNRTETWDRLIRAHGTVYGLAQMFCTADGRGLISEFLHDQSPPYVTGAYIVKTPNGMDKLDGVMWCIGRFATMKMATENSQSPVDWRVMGEYLLEMNGRANLQFVHRWLTGFPYLGSFMAYEVVSDLRHTAMARNTNDADSWAHAGPGAMRGLNRIVGRPLNFAGSKHDWVGEMRQLLVLARSGEIPDSWPKWEMREVEHTLCEFDKYERVRLGEGKPRSLFVPRT